MTEQWIDAETARNLVTRESDDTAGLRALCARAEAGLVRTQARLVLVTPSPDARRQSQSQPKRSQSEVPSEFWGAGARAALEQDWSTGDFATWLERPSKEYWQAFGVTFRLDGILEMLPPEQRAVTARRMSVAGKPAWMTADRARKFVCDELKTNAAGAETIILEQARLGFVGARAVLAQGFSRDWQADPPWVSTAAWERREWNISDFLWREWTEGESEDEDEGSSFDWERGHFSGVGSGDYGKCLIKLTGVYFLTESLQRLLLASEGAPEAQKAQAEAPAKDNPGGRPTAEWWDGMWCHVMGQIYAGTLIPKTQKAIEDAMRTWANDNGHEPAVSTIRLRARKLFKVLKEVENSLDG